MAGYRKFVVAVAMVLLCASGVSAASLQLKAQMGPDEFAGQQPIHSDDTVPPGTVITMQNWQKYSQFMSFGMQTIFARTSQWTAPNDIQFVVGPTSNFPLPRTYQDATEKYSKQSRLVQLASGGFTVQGYVAGEPFPNPSGPNAGIEAVYDEYYNYIPYRSYNRGWAGWSIDRFGNKSQVDAEEIYWKCSHLADPNTPISIAGYSQYYVTQNNIVLAPEESKYTNDLLVFYDDPAKDPETFVFVPSLRRSLRLSSAARCAPLLGGDFTQDDLRGMNIQVPIFRAQLIAEENILTMTNQTEAYKDPHNYYQPLFLPMPVVGKWENRPVWVVDVQRLKQLQGGYCYTHRVVYIDKQTLQVLHADLWDANGKFWKSNEAEFRPERTPWGENVFGIGGPGDGKFSMYDFQNNHASHALQFVGKIGDEIDPQYNSFERYATPAGMLQVMQ
jgi:Protein of unknown function (DUF1329)